MKEGLFQKMGNFYSREQWTYCPTLLIAEREQEHKTCTNQQMLTFQKSY